MVSCYLSVDEGRRSRRASAFSAGVNGGAIAWGWDWQWWKLTILAAFKFALSHND
ncbi:MAG: hypothetical protein AB4290_00805 [Spirulina sp.]